MRQRIIDLTDPQDLEDFQDESLDLIDQVCILLKINPPLFEFLKKSKGRFREGFSRAILESFSSKFNTKLLYVEDNEIDGVHKFCNPHPYYAVNPLQVEEWFDLMKEYMSVDCKDLFTLVESSKGVTQYGVTYGVMLYEFTQIPGAGLVFFHHNSESSTYSRLYIKVGNVTYYMPYKVFGKSSGRYSKITNHNYPESIKMMILSLNNLDMDDLASKITILIGGINDRRSKLLSIEEIQTLLGYLKDEAPASILEYYSEIYSEEPDKMSDQLWRLTYLNKTLGEVLDSFQSPIKSDDARTYLGQLAYDTLICDRLYKEE